jgi:DNA mismatch repair protein MSH3
MQTTSESLSVIVGQVISRLCRSARIEYVEDPLDYTRAFDILRKFYVTDEVEISSSSATFEQRWWIIPCLLLCADRLKGNQLNDIVALPKQVVVALAHAIQYLVSYGLSEAFRKTSFFIKFLTRSHMLLNANTLTNL